MDRISSVRLAATCARIAYDRKATDITVLNINALSPITDYFVIASGRNARQLRAIALQIQKMAKENSISILGVEWDKESKWILIDLSYAVVHLFDEETRKVYDLELLWGDASRVEWEQQQFLPFSSTPDAENFPVIAD